MTSKLDLHSWASRLATCEERERGRERESLNAGKEYINGETLSSISNVIQLLLLGTDPGIRQRALITPFFRAR